MGPAYDEAALAAEREERLRRRAGYIEQRALEAVKLTDEARRHARDAAAMLSGLGEDCDLDGGTASAVNDLHRALEAAHDAARRLRYGLDGAVGEAGRGIGTGWWSEPHGRAEWIDYDDPERDGGAIVWHMTHDGGPVRPDGWSVALAVHGDGSAIAEVSGPDGYRRATPVGEVPLEGAGADAVADRAAAARARQEAEELLRDAIGSWVGRM